MPETLLPELDGTSLVLVGAFNPRIFHPSWFVRNNLLPEGVEATANVEIINNDLCAFEADWFRLEVLSDRLVLRSTATPAIESLRDLMFGTFRILRHTPVQRIGLNTHAHFRLPTEERWHEFGHVLAPKGDLWEPVLGKPGTLSVTLQGTRPDEYDGHVRVKVEPSAQVPFGIFIETNDEFRLDNSDSATWIEDVLTNHWDPSRVRADQIRTHVVNRALKVETR